MRRFMLAAVLAMAWWPVSTYAQTAPRHATAKKTPTKSAVPRASNGKPDLTGVWQGGSTRRGSWEEANGGTGVGGTGRDPSAPVVLSSNDRPAGREGAPYQPWAAKKVLESFNRRGIDDPTAQCLPGGIPRSVTLGLFPQQIVQTPNQIVILYEYMNVHRVIPLNAKHPDDLIPSYMGHSVGHWEGDTLVVDNIGFNDKTWLDAAGHPHTEKLHVIERFTRPNEATLHYEATIDDPGAYSKPWTTSWNIKWTAGITPLEYICQEGNSYVEHLVGNVTPNERETGDTKRK